MCRYTIIQAYLSLMNRIFCKIVPHTVLPNHASFEISESCIRKCRTFPIVFIIQQAEKVEAFSTPIEIDLLEKIRITL